MIKCTILLKTGEKVTFEESSWLEALTRYTSEYHTQARKVKFEEEENHVSTDNHRDL